MFVKVDSRKKVKQYPYTTDMLRAELPNVSLPVSLDLEMLASYNVYPVTATMKPGYDISKNTLIEGTPVLKDGTWIQVWQEVPHAKDEANNEKAQYVSEMESNVSIRLDAHAKEHGYESIAIACSYINSGVDKFKREAQYCIDLRDLTWTMFYGFINDILAGTRPAVPYVQLAELLPPLQWPSADQ